MKGKQLDIGIRLFCHLTLPHSRISALPLSIDELDKTNNNIIITLEILGNRKNVESPTQGKNMLVNVLSIVQI